VNLMAFHMLNLGRLLDLHIMQKILLPLLRFFYT
jgi:hypothetical protein